MCRMCTITGMKQTDWGAVSMFLGGEKASEAICWETFNER